MSSSTNLPPAHRLSVSSSPYLRSAAAQPVAWYPWGPEAFAAALEQDKPLLLDIGAVWCHWCHVMDRESYENDATAVTINRNFIPVKVDRDERPDVDARYQAAVGAVTGQGGWPLTAFLLPDGRVFYGGTYFPPVDLHGRPGFPRLLQSVADSYRTEKEKMVNNADLISRAIEESVARGTTAGTLGEELITMALDRIRRSYDPDNGGFGTAPKFPHPTAMEFLLACHDRTGDPWMLEVVETTLRRMALGGVYDQLGGGFHRYSTDERWVVPHFEKMLYDNAPLLGNYVHAYQATGDPFFRNVAEDMIRFVREVLTDPQGGFYASQDADISPEDDGSYFTWSLAQAKETVNDQELPPLALHFHIEERGEMHHDPSQNVLFIDKPVAEIARLLQISTAKATELIASGKRNLIAAREKRTTPFVDRTRFASWNGMMVSSLCEAFKAFGRQSDLDLAVRGLERILREHRRKDGLITHRPAAEGAEGFLDDQVEVARSLISCFEITGKIDYLNGACKVMAKAIDEFWDDDGGGFFDIPRSHAKLGALTMVHKPIQDSPTPGANSTAASVLVRLWLLTEEDRYRDHATRTLSAFTHAAGTFGLFAAAYVHAVADLLHPPPHVVVFVDPGIPRHQDLVTAALQTYRIGKVVTLAAQQNLENLPPSVRKVAPSAHAPAAIVCSEFTCSPPVRSPEELATAIRTAGVRPHQEGV